jgi:hypothetical protein
MIRMVCGTKATSAVAALSPVFSSCSFTKPSTLLFCARAMAGSIVLYDHVSTLGVFHKKSPVSIKQVVAMLRRDFPGNDGIILLNAIQYSTRHFKEAGDSTKDLFRDD